MLIITTADKELRGKSFYAMESNPFCEECYLVSRGQHIETLIT